MTKGSDETTAAGHAPFLRRLGWRHTGFRLDNPPRAMLALAFLLAVPFVIDQLRLQRSLDRQGRNLGSWCEISREFTANPGPSVYQQNPRYLYPPFFLLLIRPLATLPLPVAAIVFETCKWLALFGSLWLAWRLASPLGEDLPPVVTLTSVVLSFRFLENDVSHGNVNLFLLVAILAGCHLALTGRGLAAGLLLAAATSVKVTPALVLVYLAYRGCWRAVVWSCAGLFLLLVALPSIWIGWEQNWNALIGWYHHVIVGFLREGSVHSIHINQSLTAILNRLLGPSAAIDPDVHLSIVVLSPAALRLIRTVLAALIVLTLAAVCRGRPDPARQPLVFSSELGLVLIAMLLLSGYSWKAHFVVMLVPYTALAAWLADARYMGTKRWPAILLTLSFALCTLTSDFLGSKGADYAEAFGLPAAGAVAAGLGLILVRRHLRRQASPLHPPTG